MNKYEDDLKQLQLCAIQHAKFMEYEERHVFRTVTGEPIGKPNYLALQSIQELVEMYNECVVLKERATPKKPLYNNNLCSKCNLILNSDYKENEYMNFCPRCGQALDWSDDNE